MSESVPFLGRVSRPDEARVRTVVVRTDGDAPGPHDEVVEIADPFAAADPARSGGAAAHVATLVRESEPLAGGLRAPLSGLVLHPPVRAPKIVCVGRNYLAHAQEMGNEAPPEPLLFYKPSSALRASGAPVELPRGYERIDMEAELVVVIGARGCDVDDSEAAGLIAGYTLGNDVSNRDLQRADKTWLRGKGFDTFAPCGPFVRITPPGTLPPPEARVQGRYDDELRQDAPISDMLFDIPTVLSYISGIMTLEPGDLVYTGTPEGVTQLHPGGVASVTCAGFALGRLTNPITAREK